MSLISTRVEIGASPEVVRAKLLGFKDIISAHFGRFRSVTLEEAKKDHFAFGRGSHSFRFSPGKIAGTTTFVHEKKVPWALGFMVAESWFVNWIGYRQKKERKYEAVCALLKVACE